MLDKVINISACVFLFGVISFSLSLINLQFKFMSFLGDYKSVFDYTAIGLGLLVCIIAAQIKKYKKKNPMNDFSNNALFWVRTLELEIR